MSGTIHGKEKVYGSIPEGGSRSEARFENIRTAYGAKGGANGSAFGDSAQFNADPIPGARVYCGCPSDAASEDKS